LFLWFLPLLVLAALIPIRRGAWQFAGLMTLIVDRLLVIFL
jgi:hypothetical protein